MNENKKRETINVKILKLKFCLERENLEFQRREGRLQFEEKVSNMNMIVLYSNILISKNTFILHDRNKGDYFVGVFWLVPKIF